MMDFPAYVPAAVREEISASIDGYKLQQGWALGLANFEKGIATLEQAIEQARAQGHPSEQINSLRLEIAFATRHRNALAENIACYRRLAFDPNMREAFALLTREFKNDEQWSRFIRAAWLAGEFDYESVREKLKKTEELLAAIRTTADKLANLLQDFHRIAPDDAPYELYSVPVLLRKTESRSLNGRNLEMWRTKQHHLLGDPIRLDAPNDEQAQDDGHQTNFPEILSNLLEGNSTVDQTKLLVELARYGCRCSLNTAWNASPNVSELLQTVARSAREFKPSESGMIGTSVLTRQKCQKNEYLRAFGKLLTDVDDTGVPRFTLTTGVMRAMAIVANVVINLPDDVDVTYDDVRKAVGGKRLENSGEN